MEYIRGFDNFDDVPPLSQVELQALVLSTLGYTSSKIEQEYSLTPKYIESQRCVINKKMRVGSALEASIVGVESGILDTRNVYPQDATLDNLKNLNNRELLIFELMGFGLQNEEIAEQLELSKEQVRATISKLKIHLNVPVREQLGILSVVIVHPELIVAVPSLKTPATNHLEVQSDF